jgi:hypothetical protein
MPFGELPAATSILPWPHSKASRLAQALYYWAGMLTRNEARRIIRQAAGAVCGDGQVIPGLARTSRTAPSPSALSAS